MNYKAEISLAMRNFRESKRDCYYFLSMQLFTN